LHNSFSGQSILCERAQTVPVPARLEHSLPPVFAPHSKPVGNPSPPQHLDIQRQAMQLQQFRSS